MAERRLFLLEAQARIFRADHVRGVVAGIGNVWAMAALSESRRL